MLLYVWYHKSQRQTGDATDNARFLPPAIGNLLLTFLAVVQPLQHVFLQQAEPGALISSYLWSRLDGEVWLDETASRCLRQACAKRRSQRSCQRPMRVDS